MGDIDINRLPLEVREHLAQLDLELSEGDITQKGYDKKRNILLAPYLKGQTNEIRAEAVQQALAECSKAKKERPKILQPIKRRGGNSFCERKNRTSDSSSDDESTLGSTGRSKQSGSIRSKDSREKLRKTRPSGSNSDFTKLLQPDVTSNAVTAGDTARVKKSVKNGHRNVHSEEVCALESTSGLGAEIIAPTTTCALNDSDLKDNVVYANTVNNYANQDGDQEYQNAIIPLKPAKVSLKIQQLLHSLQMYILLAQKERLNLNASLAQQAPVSQSPPFHAVESAAKEEDFSRSRDSKWVKKSVMKDNMKLNLMKPANSEQEHYSDLQQTFKRLQIMRQRLRQKSPKRNRFLTDYSNCGLIADPEKNKRKSLSLPIKSLDGSNAKKSSPSAIEESLIIKSAITVALAEANNNKFSGNCSTTDSVDCSKNISLATSSPFILSRKNSLTGKETMQSEMARSNLQGLFNDEEIQATATSTLLNKKRFNRNACSHLSSKRSWEDVYSSEIKEGLNSLDEICELRIGKRRHVMLSELECFKPFYNVTLLRNCRLSLQRPRKKPLHEYYNDDDAELEALAKVVDPSAPHPEGAVIKPARGEHAQMSFSLPRSLDSALYRHGTTQSKAIAAMVLDHTGKPAYSLTYGKLLGRATKVAYMLLTKLTAGAVGKEKIHLCKSGDHVALVYPNTEPLAFLVAFYGCLLAGVIPVPVEVPLTKRDAGVQQLGFLLGGCGVKVALTSEACYKGLPKGAGAGHMTSSGVVGGNGDIIGFKGWPRLTWIITEHLSKPPKDWSLSPRLADGSLAYIEYTTDKEGSVKGVCYTRQAVLSHCRSIITAMGYKEGETVVSVLDFKREAGLWHSVLASVFVGARVIFVPYSLMKINPTSWMMMVTRYQAKSALVKSRDLHWGLLASKDHKDIDLSSLRSVLVVDGANPWSLSSCDQFTAAFQSRGLRPDALCPCAFSSETGSISLRRSRSEDNNGNSARGVLSMSALSHSVVRVDQENSLTSLTLQDAGQVIPGGVAVVIKPNGPPKLCRADEVGEICLYANSTGSAYWGLDGLSASTFKVEPIGADDKPLGNMTFVRSGLLGFLGPNGLVFVVGSRSSQMLVSGRQHSADDIIATVLAVEPMRFIYRGRISVFSINVLRDERICIVAEQKPNIAEEDSFEWMSRVLQAIDSIHQVGIYCLALVPPNQLPKTPLGGIHVSETRQRFLEGCLHPVTLLMCPHSCVINLPKPREQQSDVGPAAIFVGNIVQGVRIAGAKGRDVGSDDEKSLVEVLRQRAQNSPDHILFTQMNARGTEVDSITCSQLLKKAERIATLLVDKGRMNQGEHVALVFPPGIDLIAAFYGCQVAGLVPVCIRPPHPQNLQTTLPTVRMIVDVSRAVVLLSTSSVIRLLKCKEASIRVDAKAWPTILDVEDVPSLGRKKNNQNSMERKSTDVCYLDFSVSTTGQLAGIKMSVNGAAALCKSLKIACELYPSRHITLCLDPYCGLGFALWCLSGVYSGHHTFLIPPVEVEQNPSLWLTAVSQQKVRDTFCSYGVMELCVRELAPQISVLREKGISLSCLRTCVVVAEERPRVPLCTAFTKLFSPLGLNARAVSTSFGCRVNMAICMQGAASPDPATVYVDARALRNDRVTLVEKGSPHSIALMESGKLLPGVKVAIANPETKGQCADSHLGEIWVSSAHNATGYFTGYGEENSLHVDHFNARLTTGDTKTTFARTGYLGFLRQTQAITADGDLHDAVFVVGALDEALMLRGMRYHPVDIEATVIRAHKMVIECAVFTWTHLLVVVAETEAPEAEALDLVPAITSAVLEEQHLIVGVVVITDAGAVPINSRGEKQRMHLRDAFLRDELDPVYVAYNM